MALTNARREEGKEEEEEEEEEEKEEERERKGDLGSHFGVRFECEEV